MVIADSPIRQWSGEVPNLPSIYALKASTSMKANSIAPTTMPFQLQTRRNMLRTLGIAGLATVSSVTFGPTRATFAQAEATPDATPGESIAEPFSTSDDAWEVAITVVDWRNTLFGNVAEGIFIVVLFDITNTSILADDFTTKALLITDDEGVEYLRAEKATTDIRRDAKLWGLASAPIEPGETVQTAVVFDVPLDASGLELNGPGWPEPVSIIQ